MNRDNIMENELNNMLSNCKNFRGAYCFDRVESTNTLAKTLANEGAPEGTLVLAKGQTAGRGRLGRTFYSPASDGLYMSLILRPKEAEGQSGLITACASVAVRRAVFDLTGVVTDIKWVNDLLHQGKKLCGILAEGKFSPEGELLYMILGIGLNIKKPKTGYAEEIRAKTTSLKELAPERKVSLASCAAAVTQRFFELYQELAARAFLQEYREGSCLLGKDISYLKEGVLSFGKAIAINEQAELVVLDKIGTQITLSTGEVSQVRPQ
ncbi:MAG: biotin--[Clostridia bacterium]|nr:biotin--[acetyl-CoA-carboxylase] ligase [Clostridia bacterium]